MAVIGIITCQILELEFARILTTDHDLAMLTVLEDSRSIGLIEALLAGGCRNLKRIPHIRSFRPDPEAHLEVLIRVLEIALHRNRQLLRGALARAAREIAGHADALLLGYGLCGNALENAVELLDVRVPVFVPMDNGHPVDDCVGLLLGGRKRYSAEQRTTPGTVFMIPGYIKHLSEILRENPADTDHRGLRRMFAGYERSLLVVTPVMPEEEMRRLAAEFNDLLGLQPEVRRGTLKILSETWQAAKQWLRNGKAEGRVPSPGTTT